MADSDGDGLADAQEANLRLDPRDRDSDDDQLNDIQEFNEIFSDAAGQDTDGTTLPDGDERTLGTDPTVDDADQVLDNDGDGLVNFVEDDGWTVTTVGVSTTALVQGAPSSSTRTSNKNDPTRTMTP